MLDKWTRSLLFLLVCTPIRLLIAWIPILFNLSNNILLLYGIILYLIGKSFIVLYFGNYRLNAPEGGGNTWWHSFRIVHALFYCTSGILIVLKWMNTQIGIQNYYSLLHVSQLLSIDIIFGLILFFYYELS